MTGVTPLKEEIYQKTSVYGISTLEYVIRSSRAPVDYADVEQNKTLIYQCKEISRLQGEAYHQDKKVVYAEICKDCAECGLIWINK